MQWFAHFSGCAGESHGAWQLEQPPRLAKCRGPDAEAAEIRTVLAGEIHVRDHARVDAITQSLQNPGGRLTEPISSGLVDRWPDTDVGSDALGQLGYLGPLCLES